MDKILRPLVSEPTKVYVKRDSSGNIVEINSEYFIDDFTGWEYLTEGFGDKFAHPQMKDFTKKEV